MTQEHLEYRILGILKEFNRFKRELPSDLHDDLPEIADLIRDMLLYAHRYDNGAERIWEIVNNYYKDEEI